ncbi:uncharacterized protein LOC116850820 isoform X2 [Odontomachus brunneus]|uniref:uncharacterized protein LOC116850820 isoform X2 n=1 Tax=Odontomachus brunneus TaxID=486640 RepID=UPI0013F21ACE|nr:uncharacterized protein LOC116850820 isoform X2 [Odontomachus brunneus]
MQFTKPKTHSHARNNFLFFDMAESGRNEIIDCRKSCCWKTDRIMYCIILNATDELLSQLNHNCMLKIHTFFNDVGDLMRFTECKRQSKQVEFVTKTTKSIEMLREVRGKLSTRDSSSQIRALNQIRCTSLPYVVKDFTHPRVLIRIYTDNTIPECGCALRSIGTGTQSNTANREFSSETSLNAPEKARGKKRRVDFIPEEIAKVSDTLTAEPRLVYDAVTEDTVLHARKSVMLMADGTEEETSRGRESLISPVIDAKEKSDIAAATDVATDALRREFSPIRSAEIPQDSSALSDEAFQISRLDESLDANVPMLLPIEEMRTHGDVMSIEDVEKNDSLDIAAITTVITSEKKESSNEVSLQLMIDKDIPVVDKTALDVTVSSTVTDLAEDSTTQQPAYPAEDTLEESVSTKYKMPLSEKTRAIKVAEVKHSPTGEPTPPGQNMFPESVQIKHKIPRRRKAWAAKKTDEVGTSPVGKPTQLAKDMFQESVQFTYRMPRFKKTRTIKDTAVGTSPAGEESTQLTKDTFQDSAQTKYKASRFKKTRTIKDIGNETSPAGEPMPLTNDVLRKSIQPIQQTMYNAARPRRNQKTKSIESCSTRTFVSFAWPKTTKRSCDYLERSTTGIRQDCRQLRILQPRCCERSRYHDTSRPSLQNGVTRNAASDHVCYPFLQDPCMSRCHGGYWWWGETCDTTSHRKYGATVGNSLHAHAYCNGDTGHYCPHLNAIDNCRTGYCHWNDGRSVWNNDRYYGRS